MNQHDQTIRTREDEPTVLEAHGDVAAIDKPAGWLSHPAGESTDAPDLLAWASQTLGWPSVAPVHRLDLDTSGVILLAPSGTASAALAEQLQAPESIKQYRTLVFGQTHKKGVIERPLADGRRGRALQATTRYRRLESFGIASLLAVTLLTGRKHQIRRHLQGLGHPVVGDRRYRDPKRRRVPAFPERLWLHAASISLPDGRCFEAPLPPELEAHLTILRESPRHSP